MTSTSTGAAPRWDHHEVLPGLHRLRCGISNAYVWWPGSRTSAEPPSGGGATLVDTGPVGTFPALRAALASIGVTADRLERVVLTHFHDDHTGAAAEVVAWSGARVVGGAADAPFVRGDLPGPVPVLTEAEVQLHAAVTAAPEDGPQGAPPLLPCRVDQEVVDGDVLDLAGGARVVSVPGHTPGSIALHLPALGVLLTGDTVAEHQGQLVLGPFGVDRARTRADVGRLAALGAEVACFGHGEPALQRAAERLASVTDPFA